jgi:hypothetical protein
MKMSNEEKVAQFLKSLAVTATPFRDLPGVPGVRGVIGTHMGLQVDIQVHQDNLLIAQLIIGYVPKANVAPLYRRLLALNTIFVGVYFCIFDNNTIVLRTSRNLEGLDLFEFKLLLDGLCSNYFQHVMSVVQTFQVPSQPA